SQSLIFDSIIILLFYYFSIGFKKIIKNFTIWTQKGGRLAWNFKKEPRQVSLLPRTLVILSLFLAFRRHFFRHFFSPLGGSILSCDILAGNISLLSVIVYHGPVV